MSTNHAVLVDVPPVPAAALPINGMNGIELWLVVVPVVPGVVVVWAKARDAGTASVAIRRENGFMFASLVNEFLVWPANQQGQWEAGNNAFNYVKKLIENLNDFPSRIACWKNMPPFISCRAHQQLICWPGKHASMRNGYLKRIFI
jgi:hypothetical protein